MKQNHGDNSCPRKKDNYNSFYKLKLPDSLTNPVIL